tara:strand:- start:365 stop:787 length:423 start_codon:yes stop_codon:yes gene_type:complete
MKKIVLTICCLSLLLSGIIGCALPVTGDETADTAIGTGVLGAIGGQIIGGDTESTLIGGAIGAGVGGMVGHQKKQQKVTDERIDQLENQLSTVVVKVTNSNGSRIDVRLAKDGKGGYYGPNGENYSSLPTEDQLRPVYGF